MENIITSLDGLILVSPDPSRDAIFAVNWFNNDHGKETLLLMGNTESEIRESTFESEKKTLREFLDLEKSGDQLTWMIQQENKTIGAVWVELKDREALRSPSIHIMIGDKNSRGKGIGSVTITAVVNYLKSELRVSRIYSRHLTSNLVISKLFKGLDFITDGQPYEDIHGLEWQNVLLKISI